MIDKTQKQAESSNKSQFFDTREEIVKWLDYFKIKNYTINNNLSVDVDGYVNISHKNLQIIPVKFENVSGDFWCDRNKLISLTGAPKTVGGNFWCHSNKLIDLIGAPNSVGKVFFCSNNNLRSLIGSPKTVGGNFWCRNNPLTSFLEIINCDFNGEIIFNIDETNFQPKKLIQELKKYYSSERKHYELTNRQFKDIVKPQIEKENLEQKLNSSKANNKAKISFL